MKSFGNRSMRDGMIHDEKKQADHLTTPPAPTASGKQFGSPPTSALNSCDVIGPMSILDLVGGCPCCHQVLDDDSQHSTISPSRALSFEDDFTSTTSSATTAEAEDCLPGSLSYGVQYTVEKVLVEGWLHKKGTGKDWMGSRGWKARWVRLVCATLAGYDCPVPLLQLFWHSQAPVPSTIILLESTVVIRVDLENKERWSSFRFEIRHATSKQNDTIAVTRVFTAPQQDRDSWLFAISDALLAYEKERDHLKKTAVLDSIDARGCIKAKTHSRLGARPVSPAYDEVWTGDRFVTVEVRQQQQQGQQFCRPSSPMTSRVLGPGTPPTSPRLPRSRLSGRTKASLADD